ncbi:hypothetical protein ACFVGN_44315, partial [Streptomyces sp. NPDC057757]
AVTHRRWWLEQWPDGTEYVLGLVAQDVQDALLEAYGRWPLCTGCAADGDPHALSVEPELGPEPHWVCGKQGAVVAPQRCSRAVQAVSRSSVGMGHIVAGRVRSGRTGSGRIGTGRRWT